MDQAPHGCDGRRWKFLVSIDCLMWGFEIAFVQLLWCTPVVSKICFARFFQSLASHVSGSQQSTGASVGNPASALGSAAASASRSAASSSGSDAWYPQDLRGAFLKGCVPKVDRGGSGEKNVQAEVKLVDFSLESLVGFINDRHEHTAHRAEKPSSLIGRRPNYNSRKRKLFATQPIERRKFLVFVSWHILFLPARHGNVL